MITTRDLNVEELSLVAGARRLIYRIEPKPEPVPDPINPNRGVIPYETLAEICISHGGSFSTSTFSGSFSGSAIGGRFASGNIGGEYISVTCKLPHSKE